MFEPFPKLTRFSHDWIITEKLDGSNAQVVIASIEEAKPEILPPGAIAVVDDLLIYAGSRKRLLGLGKQDDHMGFAQFVADRAEEFARLLGVGRHYGEWVGNGIQRGYGMTEKRFALFNTTRWTGEELPDRVDVVPVLAQGYMDNPGAEALAALADLGNGSKYAPGFMNPEGVVMRHGPSGTLFKKTFDYDEAGKWAENQERKQA